MVLALVASACSGSDDAGGPDGTTATTAPAVGVDYSEPGPYPVGRTTLVVADTEAFVFYPADEATLSEGEPLTSYSSAEAFPSEFQEIVPDFFIQEVAVDLTTDAPASGEGPFPLVLHSHGFSGYPLYSSQHLAHLASWGYVVAAPDHTSRNLAAVIAGGEPADGADVEDLTATLAAVEEATADDGGPLGGAVDTSRLAAEGHSAGGRAITQLALDGTVDELDTIIDLAPAPPVRLSELTGDGTGEERATRTSEALAELEAPELPSLILAGAEDGVIPLAPIESLYGWLAAPKELVVMAGTGHNFPLDICEPLQAEGGLVANAGDLAEALGDILRLGEDGCLPENLDVGEAYALRDHTTVAWLRWVFGEDPSTASLSEEYLTETFPQAVERVEAEL